MPGHHIEVRSLARERALQDRRLGFLEGQEYEKAVIIRYLRAIAAGQKPELVGGQLRQELCKSLEEDITLGNHYVPR